MRPESPGFDPCGSDQLRHAGPDSAEFALLNDYQHDFPLLDRPFAELAGRHALDEERVLGVFARWLHDGTISRIGAVLAPGRIGESALAALAVPAADVEAVAARVSAIPEVNHNYLREHEINLWFVITARCPTSFRAVIERIERDTGYPVLVLPLEEAFHIDLGFDLDQHRRAARRAKADVQAAGESPCLLPLLEQQLLEALQDGLPLTPQPYTEIGRRVGLAGDRVIEMITNWLVEGVCKRFGVVVRHHELGFIANAMCVWDVPDQLVRDLGRRMAREPGVTLCYRRRRAAPMWSYNLFCMIHGRARGEVLAVRDAIAQRHGLDQWQHAVLFSTRRFKQRGAHYFGGAR